MVTDVCLIRIFFMNILLNKTYQMKCQDHIIGPTIIPNLHYNIILGSLPKLSIPSAFLRRAKKTTTKKKKGDFINISLKAFEEFLPP